MSTTKTTFTDEAPVASPIALTPDELPQQRLYEVAQFPPRPVGLEGRVDWIDPMPDRPLGSPRNLLFLGCVEWAWSPMHGRVDSYYLNPKRDRWILWHHLLDDSVYPFHWSWQPYAYCGKVKGEPLDVGLWLLHDAWRAEREQDQLRDGFHFINDEGALGVSRLNTLSRLIWPGEEAE